MREKRLAARQKVVEAIKVTQFENKKAVSEEINANSDTELGASENVTEKEPFKIPQIDALVDSDASYQLQIEAHDDCTEEEVIEALIANFHGTLKDQMEGDNKELNHLVTQNLNEESACENEKRKIMNFKIAVKENVLVTSIIESWKEHYQFYELALKNYDYENRSIRIYVDGDVFFIWLVFIGARLL